MANIVPYFCFCFGCTLEKNKYMIANDLKYRRTGEHDWRYLY